VVFLFGSELKAPKRLLLAFSCLAFLQSLTRFNLAGISKYSGSSHGLSIPSAQSKSEGPLVWQGSTPTFVPPSGFGYPPDGFLPSGPGEPYFMLTALLGFPLRSIHRSKGIFMFPQKLTYMPFPLHLIRKPKSSYGDASRGF
jgi:hypothetical protein